MLHKYKLLINFSFWLPLSLFIVIAISSPACKSGEPQIPITEEKLIEVLLDLHRAEAIVANEAKEVKDSIAKRYYFQIFEKHGITSTDYDSSLSLMSARPLLLKKIYDRVLVRYDEENKNLSK